MATCPQCFKPIPDNAAHCGYCGAAQTKGVQEKKTMFGYAAMKPTPQAQPGPTPARPTPAPAAPAGPDALAKTQWSVTPDPIPPDPVPPEASPQRRTAPHAPAPYTPTLAAPASLPSSGADKLPAPASLRRSQAVPQAQPRTSSPPAASPPAYLATIAAGSEAGVPPTAIGPAPAIPATMYAPAQAPAAPAITPPVAPSRAPRSDVSRPVLASESLAEDLSPVEPGRTAMRVLMLLGGLLLVGLFCAPVGKAADKLLFSWDLLKHQEGLRFVFTIYLAAGGGVFLAAALLPLPYIVRALAGAVVGLAPIGVMMAMMEDWRTITTLGALALLVAALFHRWRYRGSIVARILVGLGVAGLLATLLVPTDQGVPLVLAFQGLGDASAQQLIQQLFPLVLMLLALLSLLAFLPSGTTGLAQVWAICLLLYLPMVFLWAALAKGSSDPWRMIASLQPGVPLLVYLALGPLGLAQVLAKLSPTSHR